MAVRIPTNAIRLASRHNAWPVSCAAQVCNYSTDSPRIIKDPTTASLKRGTGGRSSFSGVVCTVFGATGFVGRYLCNRLGKIGTQLIIPYRGDHYDCMRLKLCGDLGQVLFHPFDLRDEESIVKSIKYSNVVVNLISREYETKNFDFNDVNVEGSRRIARLCKEHNVERLIHLTCMNATANPKPIILPHGSRYLKSKWEGEMAVREEFPDATIIRVADIYGQEDRFINLYTSKWRQHLRGIVLWEKGEKTEKQPIHISDVATGITACVRDHRTAGKVYQFVGPHRYKLGDLVDWISKLSRIGVTDFGYRRLSMKWSVLFWAKVYFSEFISPSYPLSNVHWEGIEREHVSDVVMKGLPTLEDLGITPQPMEERLIWEVKPYRKDTSSFEVLLDNQMPEPPKPVATY